jgi:P27 family predicted phage terminase small subunit
MGSRGPKGKTSDQLRLAGSGHTAKREREEALQPQVPAGEPAKPGWLSEDAEPHWDAVMEHLRPVPALLARIDGVALALYAQSLADYIEAREQVKLEGITVEGVKGNMVTNPALRAQRSAWDQVIKASAQFGLSPADRSRLVLGDTGKKQTSDPKGYFAAG